MKKLYFAFLLLSPLLSIAQSNYKPGYTVNLKGDTIKGLVDYKEWGKNPKTFGFKKDNSSPADKYSLDNSQAFAVTGFEYYQRATVKMSMDQNNTSVLSTGLDTSSTTGTVFLRLITSGKSIALFSYTDSIKTRFYIVENSTLKATELSYHIFFNPEENAKTVVQNGYRRQLLVLAATYQPGNGQLSNQIQQSNYDDAELQKIVDKINGGHVNTAMKTAEHGGWRFFAGVAANNTSMRVNDGVTTSYTSPELHVGADIYLNKNVGDLLIRTEVYLTSNKANFTVHTTTVDGAYTVSYSSFSQTLFGINPQLLYNFYNTPSSKIYFAVGLSASFSAYPKATYSLAYGDSPSNPANPVNSDSHINEFFTITTKLGYVINNKLDLFVGYSPPFGVTAEQKGIDLKESFFKVGINFLFGKK